MTADIAAEYMGERSVEAFQRRVGKVYPKPRKIRGRGAVWLKQDLDRVVVEISDQRGRTRTPQAYCETG